MNSIVRIAFLVNTSSLYVTARSETDNFTEFRFDLVCYENGWIYGTELCDIMPEVYGTCLHILQHLIRNLLYFNKCWINKFQFVFVKYTNQ